MNLVFAWLRRARDVTYLVTVEDHLADFADGVTWFNALIQDRLPFRKSLRQPLRGGTLHAVMSACSVAMADLETLSSPSMQAGALAAIRSVEGLTTRALGDDPDTVPVVGDVYRQFKDIVAAEKRRYL